MLPLHTACSLRPKPRRPNILFLNVDQLGMQAVGAHGCAHLRTPNLDRLIEQGVSFREAHCTDPICAPSRASWFTGRMPSEHGVVINDLPILPSLPDLARWLGNHGYETVHSGKWHILGRPSVQSFDAVFGEHILGEYADESVARAAEGFLRNRSGQDPFFLVVGLLQPHDICYWIASHRKDPHELRLPEIEDRLPPLPPSFYYDGVEPQHAQQQGSHRMGVDGSGLFARDWSPQHWRYYLWAYYRHVEMVDAVVGHVLDVLEDSPYRENTLVVLASDHGEGQAGHRKALKDFLYEEAVKAPMIYSWPGHIPQGRQDREHLVSGLDLAATLCDFAGADPMPAQRGRSLRPLLEGRSDEWREFVVAESFVVGRMVRTPEFKYITYKDEQVEQLFRMTTDAWEMENLAGDGRFAATLQDHRRLLTDWEARLAPAPVPTGGWLRS